MAVLDRNIAVRAASAREIIVTSRASLTASITGVAGVKVPAVGNYVLERCQIRVRTKNNNDNTVTVTPTLNGSAITGAALAVPASAAPNLVEASPTSKTFLAPNDILAWNTGSFAGTGPSFTDVDVVFVLRTAGSDINPDTE